MRLWLLRHGQAGPYVQTGDHLRELTEHGRAEVREVARYLRDERIETLLVSPYVRARQTASLVLEGLQHAPHLEVLEGITPDDDPRSAAAQLAARKEGTLLVVSHQPLLGLMAGLLLEGHLQEPLLFNTASLALLEGEMALAGLMELRALHHPTVRAP